jgi:hypothetical protein
MPNVTPTFTNPIDLKFSRPGNADTTIRFDITANSNIFQINNIGTINNSINIDPNNWVVNQNGSITMNNSLGLEESETVEYLSLYPNPVNEFLTLSYIGDNGQFEIYDMQGRLKANGDLSNPGIINTKELSKGNYLLVLKTGNNAYKRSFIKN